MPGKVADMTVEEFRGLLKGAIKEALDEREEAKEREQEEAEAKFRADMESGAFWEEVEASMIEEQLDAS